MSGQFLITNAGVFSGFRQHFRREKIHYGTVFVGRPRRSVETQERRARAFFPSETDGSVEQTGHKPLEADGRFDKFTTERRDDAVDNAA